MSGTYQARQVDGNRPPLLGSLEQLIAVHEVCPPDERYERQSLEALALFLTDAGRATVDAGGEVHRHAPGTLVVLSSGSRLQEVVGPSVPWEVRYLMLRGPWATALEERILSERGAASLTFAPSSPVTDLFSTVFVETIRGESADPWELLRGYSELFGRITLSLSLPTGTLAQDTRRRAERLLLRETERFWGVSELATALGCTPRQLTERLKEATGLAPAAWVRRQRIRIACPLLQSGRFSVTEVAQRTGFTNPYHFSRVYKSETGESPSVTRSRSINEPLDTPLVPLHGRHD